MDNMAVGEYCEVKRGVNCSFLELKLYDFRCNRFNVNLVSCYLPYRDMFVAKRCKNCIEATEKKEIVVRKFVRAILLDKKGFKKEMPQDALYDTWGCIFFALKNGDIITFQFKCFEDEETGIFEEV